MDAIVKRLLSALVGVVALLGVGVAVTAALDPYVWPSLMIGVPVGLVAGVAALALAYVGLTYRDERRATGRASPQTVARLWAVVAAALGFVVVGGLATAVFAFVESGLGIAMLVVGLPVGLLAAAVLAYLAARRARPSTGTSADHANR